MAKAKTQHDEHARTLSIRAPGAVVRVQHPRTKRWDTIAEVIKQKLSGRSYAVKTESGRVYWCNRRFLRLYLGRLMRKGTQRTQPQSGQNRDQNHDVS